MKFIFFTDYSTQISNYCLLNVKKYKDISKLNKVLFFIDPSVYELKDKSEYSKIELLHSLAKQELPQNIFLSIDYPCDMNLDYEQEFIDKSIQNNEKYVMNSQYIATIQFKFSNFKDFIYRTDQMLILLDSNNMLRKKVLGIGNLCRIMRKNKFTMSVFKYLRDIVISHKIHWIHFYGLSISCIQEMVGYFIDLDITISIDSTKWTKRINKQGVLSNAICCRKETRNYYFLEYMKEIEKRTSIKPEY